MENAIQHDVEGLGEAPPPATPGGQGPTPDGGAAPMPVTGGGVGLAMFGAVMLAGTMRLRRRR